MASGFHAIGRGPVSWLDRALVVLFAAALVIAAIIASMPAHAVSAAIETNHASTHATPIDVR